MAPPIDFSKRFMPEALTPLWHTPVFAKLSRSQQLRYNQLQAACFNEQIIFFESAMAQHILHGLLNANLPSDLVKGIRTFMEEERRHSQMFRELNRRCFPERYAKGDFFFIRINAVAKLILRRWARYPTTFPLFLWILLIQEERALFCAKQFLAEAEALETSFVTAQRQHLADEVGHVGWDEELLDLIWDSKTPGTRRLNAAIFQWMMGEYFTTPKRSGLRVLHDLVHDDPSLRPLWPEMRRQMLDLSHAGAFRFVSYSREVTPKSFARFDRWPEFRSLGKVLAGYTPMNSELACA